MERRRAAAWIAGVGALAAGTAWFALGDGASKQAPAIGVPAEPTAPDATPALDPELAAATEEHQRERAFRDEVRDFFDRAEQLDPRERERRAEAILAGVDQREDGGGLLPAEALLIRLGLLRATVDDPAVLAHETRELTERYQRQADEARARAAARPDPRFDRYKRAEAELVREVMALEQVPDGLSRNAYLRERLRALRSDIYAPTGDANDEP